MKNILDKLDIGMKFFIIAVFGIAVIYCILSTVFGLFKDDEREEKLDVNNINKYISIYSEDTGENELDTSKLVKNHSKFYTLQTAVRNYIEAIIDGKYSKTYNLLSEEMKEKYSKSEYNKNIENFVSTHFIDSDSTYDLDYCLVRAYNINSSVYLCECKTLVEDSNIKIGIKLDVSNNTYTICYLDFNA